MEGQNIALYRSTSGEFAETFTPTSVSNLHHNTQTLNNTAYDLLCVRAVHTYEIRTHQSEMSQSGVPWKLSPLAVDQQHCLRNLAILRMYMYCVGFTTFLTSNPSFSSSSPHLPSHLPHVYHILQCIPSQEPLVWVTTLLLRVPSKLSFMQLRT